MSREPQALAEALNRLMTDRVRAIRHGEVISGVPMTQAEFARKIGVNVSTLVNIENGRQGATLPFLYKLAWAFQLEVADLLPTVTEAHSEAEGYITDELEAVLPEWADWIERKSPELVRDGGSG